MKNKYEICKYYQHIIDTNFILNYFETLALKNKEKCKNFMSLLLNLKFKKIIRKIYKLYFFLI